MIERYLDHFNADAAASAVTRLFAVSVALMLMMSLGSAQQAHAQRAPGDVGIGGQVGSPSGVTLKVYRPGFPSYDILAAWDLNEFFFVNVHGLYERHLGNSERVHFFFGPGGFVGVDQEPEEDELIAGASGRLGLNVIIERFEIYAQITPRISVVPDTEGDVGGGVGLRYYF
jgi:hypothetical protein